MAMIETKQHRERPEQAYARISNILDRRRSLYEKIGTGEVNLQRKPDEGLGSYSARVIKIGHAREAVASSVSRLEERAISLAEEINAREREQQVLLNLGKSYLAEQLQIQHNLAQIRILGKRHIPQETLDALENEYNSFLSRPDQDPRLAEGIRLFTASQEEEEKKKASQAQEVSSSAEVASGPVISPRNRRRGLFEVNLPDGTIISVRGGAPAKYTGILSAGSKDAPISIEEIMSQAGDAKKITALSNISTLKKSLFPLGWRIVQATSRREARTGHLSSYYLEKIETSETDKPAVQKNGQEEISAADQKELSMLTPRQISILCTEVQRKNGWVIERAGREVTFQADSDCLNVCRKLDQQHATTKIGKRDKGILQERDESIRAMRDFISQILTYESKGDRQFLNNLPLEIQHLIIQFMDWEEQLSATNLYAFLASSTTGTHLEAGDIGYDEACVREYKVSRRVWNAPQPFPARRHQNADSAQAQEQGPATTAQEFQEPVISEELKEPAEAEILDSESDLTVISGETEARRQRAVERQTGRERKRRERINECLDKISAASDRHELGTTNSGRWNGAAVVRVFNCLSATMMRGLVERKIIEPEVKNGSRVRGDAPVFSISDIALALYYHAFDRQITPAVARDLEKIIKQETVKREAEKNKKK